MADPKKVTDMIKEKKFSYSFEVTPDVNIEDLVKLDASPAFFSVTWHAKVHKCLDMKIAPLNMIGMLRNQGKQVVAHLSCDLMKKKYLEDVLTFFQEKGVCNLMVMLGENYNASSSEFRSTSELIKYIRVISGSHFCIGVAGYAECEDDELLFLKEKVDAGADYILTQAFFDAEIYKNYVARCTKIGIDKPVLVGVFAFENENQLTAFANKCKVKVSPSVLEYLKKNEGKPGDEITKELISKIRMDTPNAHFHFFTMNKLEEVAQLINEIE